jgi:tetratricopeptide (TPR) repeat protein
MDSIKRYNMGVRAPSLTALFALLAIVSLAQVSSDKNAPGNASPDKAAIANKDSTETSSSRDTRIDLSPPKDDAKNHPGSKDAVADLEPSDNPDTSGVQEFHPWSPLKAMKDVEVGDFYFKRKNYKGALERYKDALLYKDGDAVAISRLAVCEEKLGYKTEARKHYEQYLRILPEGPFAKDAHASLDRLAKTQ